MPHKILIVDDEPDVLRILQVILEQHGYAVTAVTDGPTALSTVAAQPPDLILLDVMMPGMSGLEVLQKMKQDPATQDIPVVILTAADNYADMEQGWQAGTDLYLTKPIMMDQLTTYIDTILGS